MSVLLCVLLLCPLTFGLEELTTTPGSDVIFESRCSSDGVVTLIEWKRSDLQPLKYVFFYRNARPYENYQNPRYRGRVELRNPEIKDGDVSITVKNVTVDDSGVYECRSIVKIGGNNVESKRVINLRVIEPPGLTAPLVWNEENEDEENKDEEKLEEEGKWDEGKRGNSFVLISGVFVTLTVGFVCVVIVVIVLSKTHKLSKKKVPREATSIVDVIRFSFSHVRIKKVKKVQVCLVSPPSSSSVV